MNPDSTLAVTNTCPKDGVHLCWLVQLPACLDRQLTSGAAGDAAWHRPQFTLSQLITVGWILAH